MARTFTYEGTMYLNAPWSEAEVTVRITYDATPYVPAKTYGPPEYCHPAEGGEIDVHSLEINASSDPKAPKWINADWMLELLTADLEETLRADADDHWQHERDDRADYEYELMRECA